MYFPFLVACETTEGSLQDGFMLGTITFELQGATNELMDLRPGESNDGKNVFVLVKPKGDNDWDCSFLNSDNPAVDNLTLGQDAKLSYILHKKISRKTADELEEAWTLYVMAEFRLDYHFLSRIGEEQDVIEGQMKELGDPRWDQFHRPR